MKSFRLLSTALPCLGVLMLAPTFLFPQEAAACTGPPCYGAALLPAESSTIPANTKSLFLAPMVRPYSAWQGIDQKYSDDVLMEDGQGGMIPVEVVTQDMRVAVVNLKQDLIPGTEYTLSVPTLCEGDPAAARTTFRLTAGPTAVIPGATLLAPISVSAAVPELTTVAVGSEGPCSESVKAVRADVSATLPQELDPWADLLNWQVMVDGNLYDPVGSIIEPRPPFDSRSSRSIVALCGATSQPEFGSEDTFLKPGLHKVSFSVTLAGASTWVSEEVDVDLRCMPEVDPDPKDPDPKDPDPKDPDPSGDPKPDPSGDPKPDPSGDPKPDPSGEPKPGVMQGGGSDDEGCNSTGGSAPHPAGLLLLGGVCVWRRRRQR